MKKNEKQRKATRLLGNKWLAVVPDGVNLSRQVVSKGSRGLDSAVVDRDEARNTTCR